MRVRYDKTVSGCVTFLRRKVTHRCKHEIDPRGRDFMVCQPDNFDFKENPMKTKRATILAVVMFIAIGVLSTSHTNAKNANDLPTAPMLTQGQKPVAKPPQGSPNPGINHGR